MGSASVRWRYRRDFFLADFLLADLRLGTFLPFLRASESPMAIACFLLFTVPPLPPLPRLSNPFLRRCMALFTSLPALREYLAIVCSCLQRNAGRRAQFHAWRICSVCAVVICCE